MPMPMVPCVCSLQCACGFDSEELLAQLERAGNFVGGWTLPDSPRCGDDDEVVRPGPPQNT